MRGPDSKEWLPAFPVGFLFLSSHSAIEFHLVHPDAIVLQMAADAVFEIHQLREVSSALEIFVNQLLDLRINSQ